jgi:hypothetical protein
MDTGSTKYAELFYSTVDNDIDALEKNVKDYPASSIARFLLLYYYKKNGHPKFDELAQQTGVYLNNPYWIQYQLSQAELSKESIESKEEEKPVGMEAGLISTITSEPIIIDNVEDDLVNVEDNGDHSIEGKEEEQNISTVINEPIIINNVEDDLANTEDDGDHSIETKEEQNISTVINEPIIINSVEDDLANAEDDGDHSIEGKEEEQNISTVINEPIIINNVEDNLANADDDGDHSIEGKEEEQNISTVINEPIIINNVEDDLANAEEENFSTVTNEPITTDVIENNVSDEEDNKDHSIEAKEEEAISTITNQPITTDAVENDSADEELIAFEPLHTVDYFASQGIKITREELEKDHFGKQVKSFTAWLKSMKKLHPAQVPEQNEVIEKIIQTSSEVSNRDVNVLTEAMAEVLVKQDKKAKAIEMYQKLSLINPSKSAYFAAKIESLNH